MHSIAPLHPRRGPMPAFPLPGDRLPNAAPRAAVLVLAGVLAGAAAALALGYFLGHDVAELAARYQLIDDAYYYLEIAGNLAGGCGATFDCRNPTNGYHPLWLLLLAGLAAVAPAKGEAQVWLMQGAGFALFAGAAALTVATARRLMPQARVAPLVAGLPLVANPSLFFVVLNGLETPVALFALALLLHLLVRHLAAPAPRAALAVGAAAGLAFLARLDYAVVAALALATMLAVEATRTRRLPVGGLVAGLLFAAVVGLYLAVNLALFDAALPVSGSIKQSALGDRLALGALFGPAGAVSALFWPLRFIAWPGDPRLLSGAAALGIAAAAVVLRQPAARPAALFCVAFGWIHAAAYLLLQSSGPEYYFMPLVLSLSWSVALLAGAAEPWLRAAPASFGRAALAALGGLAVAGPLAAGTVLERDRPVVGWRFDRLRAVAWMNAELPPGAIVGSWWSGAVGYYSDRPVINLDGLVNSAGYLERLRRCDVGPYLIESGVTHLADYVTRAMVEQGVEDPALFPGRCWAALWRDLAAAGYRLEPLQFYPDPDRPEDRGFAVLALVRD